MEKRNLTCIIIFLAISFLAEGQKVDMSLFHGIKPRNIGPAGMSGRVTAIAADPRNSDILYIGTASGGLWKTENAGTTFTPVFDSQPVASIGALAVDPLRPDIVWAGTGEGNPRNSVTGGYGIYKSLDGGKTWKLFGLEGTRHIHRIIVNPLNSDIVYAGAIGTPWGPNAERGLYKTTDGGATWQKILYNGPTVGVCDMVMDPTNPDKLFVGMWNHQRWPWFFNSGGQGSGLFVTRDGGKSFTRITKGLPAETGRIGVAIARSKPDYVYAYVESKPSAIYRSADGGETWEKRGEKNIGNRPFYYAEIYVDPENENRIYTLFSGINMSEDGGLTFPVPIAENIHLDHHAWWIDPENPLHMVDGNDGGMGITYDGGKKWRHITNLPVGQFYHIDVDTETPYRIYGGLQDNGSWAGPAYTWNSGGISNEAWDFLMGGDGFDAKPVAGDPRYCYAQSQGGALRRIDILTGSIKNIRPEPAEDERLRFNWNAALAQDPFDNNTIYFGSQFVHRSTNRGDTWEKISADLTTNDTEKLNQARSGGMTIDATGAENHCTILTISPSRKQKGVIWAGTDDGQIQLTTDGGKTWTNVSANLKGAPQKAWIPQITASEHNPAEAWAVLNNYRTGDYSAYLFYTNNFGKSWQRVIDDQDVWGYVISFVQDNAEPKLMFAGTEYGLYVSFDHGENWNKWVTGYPTVSTYDMVIHPVESDLVIGTFGRSVWIIDNIEPLREVSRTSGLVLDRKVAALKNKAGLMVSLKNLPGYFYRGDAMYEGDNRPVAATIEIYLKEEKEDKAKIEIADSDGYLIRNFEADLKKGFNRIMWRFERNQAPVAGQINRGNQAGNEQQDERMRFFMGAGGTALPGDYKVRVSCSEDSDSSTIKVLGDPRMPAGDIELLRKNHRKAYEIGSSVKQINLLYQKFYECGLTVTSVDDLARKNNQAAASVKDFHPQMKEKYNQLERKLTSRPDGLFPKINGYRILLTSTGALSEEEQKSIGNAVTALDEAKKLIEKFISEEWPAYRKSLSEKSVPLESVIKL